MRPPSTVLVILDGFGARESIDDNAVRLASTPHLDALFKANPHTEIATSGAAVGLPPGQMGNSEVGHLNLGAGRVAMMELSRIDLAVYENKLAANPAISTALKYAVAHGGRLHLLGLVSDGGVHSSIEHLLALIDIAAAANVTVVVHAFLDGRDVQPGTAAGYLATLESHLIGKGVVGTISGRFYAMDRDQRWERVQLAYDAIASGTGANVASAAAGFAASVANDITDEFVRPAVVANYRGIANGDAALHFNFRPDRARELTAALGLAVFSGFERANNAYFSYFVCMTQYDATFHLPVAFSKDEYQDTLGEVLANANIKQFRCAETEKYAHITYFFNGSREAPFPGEQRKVVPSPKDVATYDLKPEMSSAEVTNEVVRAIESREYGFVLVNFANPDMVGHTGNLAAAIAAVEAVDRCVGQISAACIHTDATLLVTADHGNCELMRDPASGKPHTSHTTYPVPFIVAAPGNRKLELREGGVLADVAPTILELLKVPQPAAMTGRTLLRGA
jgi:2,3-bisphosphoglycerate-independent phosphoglycerate mutase